MRRYAALLVDNNGFIDAPHHAGSFVTYVRRVYATEWPNNLLQFHYFRSRSKCTGHLEQAGTEPEGSIPHALPH
jgi:hypothetical protein